MTARVEEDHAAAGDEHPDREAAVGGDAAVTIAIR